MTDGTVPISPEKGVAASALLSQGATPASQKTQQTQQRQDGTPPAPQPPPAAVTPPEAPPRPFGTKPTLMEKLQDPSSKRMTAAMWQSVEDAKDVADDEAQEDLLNMVTDANSGAFTLWMSKYSTEVQLGHSSLRYMAEKGDRYHRRQIVFLGDRAPKGDPHAWAVSKDERKHWGKWKKVDALTVGIDRSQFFDDKNNAKKLYTPPSGANTGPKDTPYAQPAGHKTAEYVLKHRPSPGELEAWAESNLEGKEKELIAAWAALASQSKPGAKPEEATSILSHNLEIIVEASSNLEKTLGDHLDVVLGKGIAPPPANTITNNYTTVNNSGQGNTSGENSELMTELRDAVTGTNSKSKLTDALKETIGGYFGRKWSAPSNDEVTARWEAIDKVRGKPHDLLKKAEKYLTEVGEKLGLHPKGQLIHNELYVELLEGKFCPNWAISEMTPSDYHQGLTALRFGQYMPEEIGDYLTDIEAHEMSKPTRTLDQARQMLGKKPRAPPDTYDSVCNMVCGAARFYATWFGETAPITIDYLTLYALLRGMVNFESAVATTSWLSLGWLLGNNDRQYFSVRVDEETLRTYRGLPVSNVSEEVRRLRVYKSLPRLSGVPHDWYASRKRGERDNERRQPYQGDRERNQTGRDYQGGRDGKRQRFDDRQQSMTPNNDTHPKIMDMMKEYYEMYPDIYGRRICEKAGVKIGDLKLGKVCLNHILGKCNFNECATKYQRQHPKGTTGTQKEVDFICGKLRSGVDAMVRAKRGRGDEQRQGWSS